MFCHESLRLVSSAVVCQVTSRVSLSQAWARTLRICSFMSRAHAAWKRSIRTCATPCSRALVPAVDTERFCVTNAGLPGKTGVCANMKTAFQVQGAEHRPQSGKGLRFAHHHSRAENCASLSPGDLSVRLVCLETKLVRSSYTVFCVRETLHISHFWCVSLDI